MENKPYSVAEQSVAPVNLSQNSRTDKVPGCVYPDSVSCRGCSYSYRPDLFDGGCKLYYEGRQRKNDER